MRVFRYVILGASLTACGTFAQNHTTPSSNTSLRAVVIREAGRPRFVWGIEAVWADFEVELADGSRPTMFMPYMTPDQFIPPRNSICEIVFDRRNIQGSSSSGPVQRGPLRNVVRELNCDTGRLTHPF